MCAKMLITRLLQNGGYRVNKIKKRHTKLVRIDIYC